MFTIRHASLSGLVLLSGLILGGCSTTHPVAYHGLASSNQLATGANPDSAKIPFEYTTNVNWDDYSNALLEPVVIYRGRDNQFEKITEDEKQELAQYLQQELLIKMKMSRLLVVRDAQPRSLRIRVTLTGAKLSAKFLGTAMRFDLAGGTYNIVQSARGREGAFTGSVNYAVEIFDASNGQLLNAYIGKQFPNAMNVKATLGRLDAAKVGIGKAAEDLARRLD